MNFADSLYKLGLWNVISLLVEVKRGIIEIYDTSKL